MPGVPAQCLSLAQRIPGRIPRPVALQTYRRVREKENRLS